VPPDFLKLFLRELNSVLQRFFVALQAFGGIRLHRETGF
jgi:hypothetical protein